MNAATERRATTSSFSERSRCSTTPADAHVWEISGAPVLHLQIVPDLTGDGLTDALIRTTAGSFVMAGPLGGPRLLPEDAAATFVGLDEEPQQSSAFEAIVDVDGDEQVDVVGWAPANRRRFVGFGPFAGQVDTGTLPDFGMEGRLVDIDGDGRVEVTVNDYERVVTEVWSGPWGAWQLVLTIAPDCDTSGFYQLQFGSTHGYPDVDGDGVGEIVYDGVSDDGEPTPCQNFLFPADVVGTIDPVAAAYRQVPPFSVVGDQTCDGVRDVQVFEPIVQILAGPVTFRDGAIDATLVMQPSPDLRQYVRTPFDVDGDAIGDWLVDYQSGPPHDWAIVTGGPLGGFATGVRWASVPIPWDYDFGDNYLNVEAFWEDGEAWVAVAWADRVEVRSLGAASPVGVLD